MRRAALVLAVAAAGCALDSRVTIEAGVFPTMTSMQVEAIALAEIDRMAADAGVERRPARVLRMTAWTYERAGSIWMNPDVPPEAIVWTVEAEGTFFRREGSGKAKNAGEMIILDADGRIIGMGLHNSP